MPWTSLTTRPITNLTRAGKKVIFWESLSAPTSGINPAGGINDADRDPETGGFLFDNSSEEIIVTDFRLPHSWEEGSVLWPNIHWCKTTSASGSVVWQFEYKWFPSNEVLDAEWTTLTTSTVGAGTTDTDTANKHIVAEFDSIDTTGKTIGDILIVRITRLADDVADDYAADAEVFEVDLQYQRDLPGSHQQYIKGRA